MVKSRNTSGFTLIELMIVVAIVGILASIAYPNYVEYVRRGSRAEARAAMLSMAQLQERNFTDRGVYVAVAAGVVAAPWGSANWSGSNYASRKYNITVASVSPFTTYAITATPVAPFSDPSCGNLSLASDGTKGTSVSTASGVIATCWK